MKFKSIYIYFILAAIIVLYLIFSSGSDNEPETAAMDDIHSQIPDDDVHRNMSPNLGENPSKGNVRQDILDKMDSMKRDVEANRDDTLKIKEYARFLTSAHKLDDAEMWYNEILSKDPNRIDILLEATFVQFRKQDFEKATSLTNKILEINPDSHEALYNVGALAAAQGDTLKALKVWGDLVKRFPGSEAAEIAQNALNSL